MMKQIALTIEKMKHLESLGLDTSDASMMYQCTKTSTKVFYDLFVDENDVNRDNGDMPAYTLQDILRKLPKYISDCSLTIKWGSYISYVDNIGAVWDDKCCFPLDNDCENLLEPFYQMLLWCIENNYVKTNKV